MPLNRLANLLTNYFDVDFAVVVISPVRMVVSPHALTSFLDSDFLILNLNFDFVGFHHPVVCHCVNDGWIKVPLQNGIAQTRFQVHHCRVVIGLQRNLRGLS